MCYSIFTGTYVLLSYKKYHVAIKCKSNDSYRAKVLPESADIYRKEGAAKP